MNRHEWEFEYTARDLAKAAGAQRDYRRSRITAWEGKKQETMEKIKTSGLTVHESVAEKFAGYTTNALHGQRGAQVMVDATLQKDLDECVGKIRVHRELAQEYDAWLQVLEAQPETRLKLQHDDWLFFYGK